MSRACVFKGYKRFKGKEEREEVEDDLRSGRSSTNRNDENIKIVRQKLCGNHWLTIQMIANKLGISCKRVWTIITEDLRMKKICAKMVPHLLHKDQIKQCVQVCHDILEQLKTELDLLRRVVMSYGYLSMIYSPKDRALSGRVQHHQDPNK